jgi:hypothetical protein
MNLSDSGSSSNRETKPNPCPQLSPNLWLTMVIHNSIHPIKVLEARGATYFPAASGTSANENIQQISNVPKIWVFAYILCLVLLGHHLRRGWTGGTLGEWLTPKQYDISEATGQKKAWVLCLGSIILTAIYVVLVAPNTPDMDKGSCLSILWFVFQCIVLLAFIGSTCWDFWKRRGEKSLCCVFLTSALFVSAAGIWYATAAEKNMVLWQERALSIGSSISPTTPFLVLLLGLYVCFWFNFQGLSLMDWRCPQLPAEADLQERFFRLTDRVGIIKNIIQPFSGPVWILYPIAAVVIVCPVLSFIFGPGHLLIRSLEGLPFDLAYFILFGISLVALIVTLCRMIAIWLEFSLILAGLNQPGLKEALRRLPGFEWKVIWNPARSVRNEGYKLIGGEIRTIECLKESLGASEANAYPEDPLRELRAKIETILSLRSVLIKKVRESQALPARSLSVTSLAKPYEEIQGQFAKTAALLCEKFLVQSWMRLSAEDDSNSSGQKKSSCTEINIETATIKVGTAEAATEAPSDPSGLSHNSLRLAEEFFAYVYANFLVTVLLRVRGLVMTAAALYVCIVFSTISYPFDSAPELSTLAIVLFLVSAAAIGYVYEDMHRDPTLSKMTSTDPNKIDSAFWIKFATAGFAPFVALVSAVYPPFGHLLYSLVGPLLQALR